MPLTLTLSPYTVTIPDHWFTKGKRYPSWRTETDITTAGNPLIWGPSYELQEMWDLQFKLPSETHPSYSPEFTRDLDAILRKSDRLRYTPPYTNYRITLIDERQRYQEPSPRTRAKTAAAEITNDENVLYYGYFYVVPKTVDLTPGTIWDNWTLLLEEHSKYPA